MDKSHTQLSSCGTLIHHCRFFLCPCSVSKARSLDNKKIESEPSPDVRPRVRERVVRVRVRQAALRPIVRVPANVQELHTFCHSALFPLAGNNPFRSNRYPHAQKLQVDFRPAFIFFFNVDVKMSKNNFSLVAYLFGITPLCNGRVNNIFYF